MQFIKENNNIDSDINIVTEHKGQQILWNIRTYRTFKINPDTVLDINNFWARLPEVTQDAIFKTYQDIYNIFMTVEATDRLNQQLTDKVAELFSYHSFEEAMHYFNFHAQVQIPTDLDANKNQKDYVKELTYDTNEYRELAGLTMLMKIMVPIWGEYITSVASEMEPAYKEYMASTLLKKSNILETTAYKRLKLYIDTYYGDSTKGHSPMAILSGLPKESVSDWLLGNVLVRRVASSELTQRTSQSEPRVLIKHIYNFIYNINEGIDKRFGGHINEKSLEKVVSGEDDNTSVLENYKIKQEISEGVILTHAIYLQRHFLNIIDRLDPTAPKDQLLATMEIVRKHLPTDFVIDEFQRTLIKWVLDPVVTAEMIEYVDYDAIMTAYCITHTLLEHWKFDHLAMMMFARRRRLNITGNNLRQQMTNQQLDKLDEIYVDQINDNRKRNKPRNRANVAANAILTVLTDMYGSWWQLAPWEQVSQYPRLSFHDDCALLPQDIEPQMADLIIHLKTNIHPKLYHFDPKTGVYTVRPPEDYIDPENR